MANDILKDTIQESATENKPPEKKSRQKKVKGAYQSEGGAYGLH
jgi:hypothetical protein